MHGNSWEEGKMIQKATLKDVPTIMKLIRLEYPSLPKKYVNYAKTCVIDSIKNKEMNVVFVAKDGCLIADVWKKKFYSYLVIAIALSKKTNDELYDVYVKFCRQNGLKFILTNAGNRQKYLQKFCKNNHMIEGMKSKVWIRPIAPLIKKRR